MIRYFAIAAFAFAAASNAWADSGCYAGINVDTACPVAKKFTGLCLVSQKPKDAPASATCSGYWYVCVSNDIVSGASCETHPKWNKDTQAKIDSGTYTADPATNKLVANVTDKDALNQTKADTTAKVDAPATPDVTATAKTATKSASSDSSDFPKATKEIAKNWDDLPNIDAKPAKDGAPGSRGLRAVTVGPGDSARMDDKVQGLHESAEDALNTYGVDSPQYRTALNDYDKAAKSYAADKDDYDSQEKKIDDDQAKADRNNDRPGKAGNEADSDCSLSGKLQTNMNCSGTRRMIKANEMTNQIGQVAGTLATNVTGAQAQNSAITAGTQSAALRAGATTTGNTGKAQMLLGTVNAMMGFMAMKAGYKHDGYAKTIKSDFQGGNLYKVDDTVKQNNQAATDATWKRSKQDLAEKALHSTSIDEMRDTRSYYNTKISNLNDSLRKTTKLRDTCIQSQCTDLATLSKAVDDKTTERDAAIKAGERDVIASGQSVSQKAMGEQQKVADDAKNAGIMAMMQGATQMGQGILNMKAADQLNQAADQMEATENSGALTLAPPGQDAFPSTDPRAPTVITGNGAPPPDQSTATDQTPTDNGTPPLGGGLPGPTDNTPQGVSPSPGQFVGGQGGGPLAAGGSPSGLGGGSTQAPGPDGGDKGPTAANSYVAGTTPVSGGGPGMMGPPPGGKEASMSPADMMAQALGLLKPQEKDPNSQAYAGGRGPASSGMGGGLGLPEEDIFKIVEGGYRRQIKAGNIGG